MTVPTQGDLRIMMVCKRPSCRRRFSLATPPSEPVPCYACGAAVYVTGLCYHANENPHSCPCLAACECRRDMCMRKPWHYPCRQCSATGAVTRDVGIHWTCPMCGGTGWLSDDDHAAVPAQHEARAKTVDERIRSANIGNHCGACGARLPGLKRARARCSACDEVRAEIEAQLALDPDDMFKL